MDAGPTSVCYPPRPRHREPRKRRPREFCRTLALRRAVSSGDPSEARQRETAAVQTLGDGLAVGDDGDECCYSSREGACMRVCVLHHMTSVDGTDWREAGMLFLAGRISSSPRSPHICKQERVLSCSSVGAKRASLLIYWVHRLVRAPSISPRIEARVQRRLFCSVHLLLWW